MTAREILEQIPKKRVLVVGDICLDRWCIYDPALSEPSRETGIPRVAVIGCEVTPGAGGTVANNLIAMGAKQVAALGVVGEDGAGFELRGALSERGIDGRWMVSDRTMQTFTYTKYLNATSGEEDLPRTDFVNPMPPHKDTEGRVLENLRRASEDFDVILVSDQAETEVGGVVTGGVREMLSTIGCRNPEKILWVDSRVRAELFRDVILKTNEEEAIAACARAGNVEMAGLRSLTRSPYFLVTHGGDGVDVYSQQGTHRVCTAKVESPVDICGAGDSFSAGTAMALAVTGDIEVASRFGNAVASVTIMKKGTGTASPEEILRAEQQIAL